MGSLVLYVLIHKGDKETCVRVKEVPTRFVNAKWKYVGLRETIEAAIKRRNDTWDEKVKAETHEVLKVEFTEVGVGRLTIRACCGDDHFCSTLFKKKFTDPTTDWKTWHYMGSLPLPGHPEFNEENCSIEWLPLPGPVDSLSLCTTPDDSL
jgi:hypothetical protein